jgi:transposase-like protein
VGRKVDVSDLVGTAEIAERLGIAYPETIHSWRTRYRETESPFPEPVAKLRQALVWVWTDVEKWARGTGRL